MSSVSVGQSLMIICVPGTGLGSENIMKVKWVQFRAPRRPAGEVKREMNMLKCFLELQYEPWMIKVLSVIGDATDLFWWGSRFIRA